MTTITKGQKVLAADYMSYWTRVNAVLGTGPNGYGQTLSAPTASYGGSVKVSDWNSLVVDINKARSHQSGGPFSSTTLTSGNAGDGITSTFVNTFDTAISQIETNVLLFDVGSVAVSSLNTVTRSSTWGSGSAQRLTLSQSFTFSSVTSAQYFFNSGGALTVTLAHPNTSSTQNQYWHSTLASIGTITMSAKATSSSAGGSTSGFYALGTTPITIFSKVGGSGGTTYYTSNKTTVSASVSFATITLKVELLDSSTGTPDSVASGTNCSFGMRKAVTYLTEESPTFVAGTWTAST